MPTFSDASHEGTRRPGGTEREATRFSNRLHWRKSNSNQSREAELQEIMRNVATG